MSLRSIPLDVFHPRNSILLLMLAAQRKPASPLSYRRRARFLFVRRFYHSSPRRERLARRLPERRNQLPHLAPALHDILYQLLHRSPVVAGPLRRNISGDIPDDCGSKGLNPGKPWFKRLPPAHILVNKVARVHAAQRDVRKIPLARIETITLGAT